MRDDATYLNLVLDAVRVCAKYQPGIGTLPEFRSLYQADPFYSWFGLDNPLMYAAHKAAGGMTSIYRQIGIGCERLFNQILQDQLGLSADAASWSYEVIKDDGKIGTLYLDGRIPLAELADQSVKDRVHDWVRRMGAALGVDAKIIADLTGVVFEVRQGYKSMDSKRQNADIRNAATAYTKTYLPCIVVLSTQINPSLILRYRNEKWAMLTGIVGANDPLVSTYDFMRDVIGYDLAALFDRNREMLRRELDAILRALLTPDAPTEAST